MDTPKNPLQAFRTARGWSLDELSEKLQVSKMTLSRWENGKAMPRRTRWARIAMVTGVTPEQIAASYAGQA